MIRNILLGSMLLAFAVTMAGCAKVDPPRNDMPVKGTAPVNPKTGKPSKALEATIEDTPKK